MIPEEHSDPRALSPTPPAPVADALSAYLRRRGWQRRLEGARIHERWEEIAGRDLAAHVRPVRLHGGVLVLEVSGGDWATQVRYLTPDLVRRADEVLGEGQVRTVRVVVARDRPGRRGR